MFALRQYTGFVLLVFVPLIGLVAVCTIGYLLAVAGKRLTRMVIALTFRKRKQAVEPTTSTSLTLIQPRVTVVSEMKA
jgi:hypothetical protein